ASRSPFAGPARTAATQSRPATGWPNGARGLGPLTAPSISAASSTVRATGPVTCRVSHTQSLGPWPAPSRTRRRSEEHTSELQSRFDLVCRLLLEKKKKKRAKNTTTQETK